MEDGCHCLAQLLLITVIRGARRLLLLTSVNAEDIAHQSAHQVVCQGFVALLTDKLLLCLILAIVRILDDVGPLLAIDVILRPMTIPAEPVHVVPVFLGFEHDVEGPPVTEGL